MAAWIDHSLKLINNVLYTQGEDYLLAQLTKQNGVDEPPEPLIQDEDYVTINVRSYRIVDVRKWTGKFYGSIEAKAHYWHERAGLVELHRVIVPELKEIDPLHIDRMIVVDSRVVGPVPYAGEMSLELGLFSVKSTDLASPYLDLLIDLTKRSGSLNAADALPYAEVLRKGASLLFGNSNQASLEIGLKITWKTLSSGVWLLMRAPKEDVDLADIRLDPSDGRITDADGKPYRQFPYLVFSIERSQNRDDYMTIPSVRAAWAELDAAVSNTRSDLAEKILNNLLAALQWSPDLIPSDAKRLCEKMKKKALPRIQSTTVMAQNAQAEPFPDLESLDLYDRSTN